jgi:predicted enzyme related to lactoylglutathione lyase
MAGENYSVGGWHRLFLVGRPVTSSDCDRNNLANYSVKINVRFVRVKAGPVKTKKGINVMNPVVHFEMPYENRERMAAFYEGAFGWQPQMLGPEMGNYVVVRTTETDETSGFPKNPGMINGGFFQRTSEAKYPSVVISVDDIKTAMKKVEEAGGTVLGGQQPGEPDDIPGVGLYAAFVDTEGNRAGILQPTAMAGSS